MVARFLSCWQKIKQHRVTIGVVAIVFVVVIVLIIIGYWFDWTGFNGYNQVTITRTMSGTNAGTVTRTEVYQPGKGLWDWLQLLSVLAIPVVVGFGAVWFTTRQVKVADAENTDNQRETALQAYIDKMSDLLLNENLRDSDSEKEVRKIARVRTLTVLSRLDDERKGRVLQFLHESHLIDKGLSIIDLDGANLCGANLSGTNLRGANLDGTNLSGASLYNAILYDASLFQADLSGADLSGAKLQASVVVIGGGPHLSTSIEADLNLANLSLANLIDAQVYQEQLEKAISLHGATMPDGSIHD